MSSLKTRLSLERLENRETPSPIGPESVDPNAPTNQAPTQTNTGTSTTTEPTAPVSTVWF